MKRIYITLLFFIFTAAAFSQQVIFCEDVDKMGIPKNVSTEFTIGDKGGFFKILVKLNKKVNCQKVVFDLYNVVDGKEILDNTLRMDVDPSITWFYKEVTFFKKGEFNVYVYDEVDRLLGVGKVKVK